MIEGSSEARKLEYIPSVSQRRGPEWALALRKDATYIVQSDSLSANIGRQKGRMFHRLCGLPAAAMAFQLHQCPGWSVFQKSQ